MISSLLFFQKSHLFGELENYEICNEYLKYLRMLKYGNNIVKKVNY